MEGCAKLTAVVYSHNRKKDVEGIPTVVVLFLFLAAIFMLTFIFLLYYGIRDESTDEKIAGFFMLGFSVAITCVIAIVNFLSKPENYTPFPEMVLKALSKYFTNVNKKYEERGLKWEVEKDHYFLKCRINKQKKAEWRRRIKANPSLLHDSELEEEDKDNTET